MAEKKPYGVIYPVFKYLISTHILFRSVIYCYRRGTNEQIKLHVIL